MSASEVALNVFSDERAFHSAWQTACAGDSGVLLSDEVELALAAGAIADRLAWVFVSGYQAAVRRCFPELTPGNGWTCLAAAEGRGGPACVLTSDADGYLLSGEKSWIAGAGVLDSLVVSVAAGEDRRFAAVPASAPGVQIDLPRSPGFLGEMSQGMARFQAVRIPAAAVLAEPARGLWFRGAEPLYVMLALNACLRSRALTAGDEGAAALALKAIEHGRSLPAVLAVKADILAGLAELRRLTTESLAAAAGVVAACPTLTASWQQDAKFFTMFGIETEELA